jgi:hypothetical protein
MASLDASEVSKLLAEYGRRTAPAVGNPYRSKTYLRAGESLADFQRTDQRLIVNRDLT